MGQPLDQPMLAAGANGLADQLDLAAQVKFRPGLIRRDGLALYNMRLCMMARHQQW